ncbi:MAG: metalloprotease PmbA [Burkholderiales bacterium]
MSAQVNSAAGFSYAAAELQQYTADLLNRARELGASSAEADVSEGWGHSVNVRMDAVETIEYHRDKGLSVTVYFGKQKGHAGSSDFSPKAMRDTVEKACSIAKHTAIDEFSGLADPALLATGSLPNLDLYHPWGISVEQSIELGKRAEAAAFAIDSRIDNSDGASVSTQDSHFCYGNSSGFLGGYPSSRHGVSCSVIASEDDAMQRDDWYSTARDFADLERIERVGQIAGERVIRRLNGRKLKTLDCPVLFEAPIAQGIIGHFVGAVSGGSLYRKSSFLIDSLGKQIFPRFLQIREIPHLGKGLSSSPFDSEGVATKERDVIKDGVLQGYFLGSYSARKLGMQSTGNAGGNYNLIVPDTGQDFAGLIKQMDHGLLVTELLGHGINMVTGDYSRGASGYWVEGGEIQYPVEEITVAGNLKDMFKSIVAIGNDVVVRGSKLCGSILIERMTVAGD